MNQGYRRFIILEMVRRDHEKESLCGSIVVYGFHEHYDLRGQMHGLRPDQFAGRIQSRHICDGRHYVLTSTNY